MVDVLGLVASAAMVTCYALENRDPAFTWGFAGACVAASGYAYAIAAWPFCALEGVWAVVAFRRGWRRSGATRPKVPLESPSEGIAT